MGGGASRPWIEDIVDPAMQGKFDRRKMDILIGVAVQCPEEDRDSSRPAMSQIVEKLMIPEGEMPELDIYPTMT